MASRDALNPLHKQAHFLTSAEEHLGDMIRELRTMQDREHEDVQDAIENRLRFLQLAKAAEDLGHPDLARLARDGAALEEQQIERNKNLILAQGTAIGLLQATGEGLNRLRQFAHRISRAVSNFLAD